MSAAKLVAPMVPVPETASEPPVPSTIAAVVFVPLVRPLNAVLPPDPQSEPVPERTPEVLTCKHCVEPVMPDRVRPDAVAAPILGVVRAGEVAKTSNPVPVSLVTALARFALVGVARNVATLVPSPDTPEAIGKPVRLVATPVEGVPSAPPLVSSVELAGIVVALIVVAVAAPRTGVTKVGEVASTTLPVPVVDAATSADELLLPMTVALAGTVVPLTAVALIVPVPVAVSEAPELTTIVALLFVPVVTDWKLGATCAVASKDSSAKNAVTRIFFIIRTPIPCR